MGSGNASTKSKKYQGPTNNSTSKTSLSLSAASISKQKSNNTVAWAARAQRKQQALHLRCNVAHYFCAELSPSELAEIWMLRDPPAQEDADWEMSDDMLEVSSMATNCWISVTKAVNLRPSLTLDKGFAKSKLSDHPSATSFSTFNTVKRNTLIPGPTATGMTIATKILPNKSVPLLMHTWSGIYTAPMAPLSCLGSVCLDPTASELLMYLVSFTAYVNLTMPYCFVRYLPYVNQCVRLWSIHW